VVAVHLDDPAFVDAGVLHVGDRFVLGRRGLLRRQRGGRRRGRGRGVAEQRLRALGAPGALLVPSARRFVGPALEEFRELLLARERGQGLARRGGSRGGACRGGGEGGNGETGSEGAAHGGSFREGSGR
jgi:hypothetical protein